MNKINTLITIIIFSTIFNTTFALKEPTAPAKQEQRWHIRVKNWIKNHKIASTAIVTTVSLAVYCAASYGKPNRSYQSYDQIRENEKQEKEKLTAIRRRLRQKLSLFQRVRRALRSTPGITDQDTKISILDSFIRKIKPELPAIIEAFEEDECSVF